MFEASLDPFGYPEVEQSHQYQSDVTAISNFSLHPTHRDPPPGGTSWAVWRAYLLNLGPLVCAFLGACMVLGQVAYVASQYWLATVAYRPLASQQRPLYAFGVQCF